MIRSVLLSPLPLLTLFLGLSCGIAAAQAPPPNYDEAAVPAYTLPDPLVAADGTRITSADEWRERRRPELLRLFAQHVYGEMPSGGVQVKATTVERSEEALGGRALRKQVRLVLSREGRQHEIDLLMYLPRAEKPVPVFLGLNFRGNQAVNADPAIALSSRWQREGTGVEGHRATPATRGAAASRWPIELIVQRGYGLVTVYYGDLFPDHEAGAPDSVLALFGTPPTPDGRTASDPGALAAWAWGLSRILDYLDTDPDVDATRVALLGHSRLGKAALWAGALDDRFALVISNDSGAGGAALSRRAYGETVGAITARFPHWFAPRFSSYANRESALPVDQHQLLALVAPRPLYVASAVEDRWADPRGEFLAALGADPVYRLLGTRGLPVRDMPPVDQPVHGTIGYHIRSGGHDVTRYDWEQFLAFADQHGLRARR